MTNEERQKLCAALRQKGITGSVRVPMCAEAADEIERLAAKDTTLQALIGVLTYENKRAADEIERLAEENKRLAEENRKLKEENTSLWNQLRDYE